MYKYWSRPPINVLRKILTHKHCSGSTVQTKKNIPFRYMSYLGFPFNIYVNPDSLLIGRKKLTTYITNNTGTTKEGTLPHSLLFRIFKYL